MIDVGCGTGELLARVVARYGCNAVGIDNNQDSLGKASANCDERSISPSIEFTCCDINEYEPTATFSCGICIASTHAFAMGEPAYGSALDYFAKHVTPSGLVMIGEGFWERPPTDAYRDYLGEPIGVYRTHFENVQMGVDRGLSPLYATTSSLDEWDEFEWKHHIEKERLAKTLDESEADALRKKWLEWRMAYLKWGRGTMGFGFYLFRSER